ncbi:UNVERIFIED_CONTAM: Retrovirus-related Pol polyprotein from transposon TNT 1-94 [Sesamum angustifolium]|uniref:Retrovirus-related Pol polyprotein from transposon TNT 1-94 n=1 Tax=Sesamum angustifolium TaxID=2727405 RepID=A0AAW2Q871_9LAMI
MPWMPKLRQLKKNGTWELIDRPKGAKIVGVKWIYKTKFNEKGEVDKFKARLVVKGYAQKYGIDYTEVFAPVARMETVRLVIALATQKGWAVYQLDVKSAFLHGELVEDVFVEQPCGYIQKGKEEKVYKLKKALYGLKQALRAWMSYVPYCHSSRNYVCHKSLSRFLENPTQLHLQLAKRVLRYLQRTMDYGIFYKKGGSDKLTAYTDSDYTGDLDDRKSTSGNLFLFCSGAVSWSSKKQPIVSLSTTEAEFITAASCSCQAIWLKRLLMTLDQTDEESIVIH